MAFHSLPIEVNEHIASFIDNDKDLCNFTLICPDTHNAVHSHRNAVWRAHFAKRYDLGPGKTGRQLMISYMTRRMVLRRGVREGFQKAKTQFEQKSLGVLRELIVESFASTTGLQHYSHNLCELREFVWTSNFLDIMLINAHKSEEHVRLMQTIQVVLTHLHLDLSITSRPQNFGLSQQAMYCLPSKMPLFLDKKGTINMDFMLHIVNFFKQHMTCHGPIENTAVPKTPGLEWRGSYAYIPNMQDLQTIRARDSMRVCLDDPIPDAIDYDEGFQTLILDPIPNMLKWPAAFENHLRAIPPAPILAEIESQGSKQPASTRRSSRTMQQHQDLHDSLPCAGLSSEPEACHRRPQLPSPRCGGKGPAKLGKDYLVFTGTGKDLGPYQCSGVIHNLPPQSGIPGWQRMCMMKYTVDPSSDPSSPSDTPSSDSTAPTSSSSSGHSSSSSISLATSNGYGSSTSSSEPFEWAGDNNDDDPIYVDDDCWCYEGIVLPGGKIILGRWWHPLEANGDDLQSIGPFLFWNLDR